MINLFLHLFEKSVMEEKEVHEARERVRAEMRNRFSFQRRVDPFDDETFPVPQSAGSSGPRAVKPYIPPTMPNEDNPYDPFGLGEAPLR